MRYESTGVVVVPRTNGDRNNVRQFPDETGNFARLFPRGLDIEHVEQITDDTDEVVIWRLLYQPLKSVKAKVKIGGQEKFHDIGKMLPGSPSLKARVHWLALERQDAKDAFMHAA